MYDLKRDDEFFLSQRDELLKDHENECVLIHDCTIVRFFASRADALSWAKGKYKLGEFLIGEIKKDEGPEYISYKFSFCG
ncbi:MAG: hypothetical protein IKS35_00895 [Clostridia bacterium]|nr:hypothetical protein [Clostridia bacterium]